MRWLGQKVLIGLVRFYQVFISAPLHFFTGPLSGCRFEPTCSQYFIEAVLVHGPLKGAGMGIWRILRCQPWGGQGYDPVPGWEEYVEKNPRAAYIGRRKPGGDAGPCCSAPESDAAEEKSPVGSIPNERL